MVLGDNTGVSMLTCSSDQTVTNSTWMQFPFIFVLKLQARVLLGEQRCGGGMINTAQYEKDG